MLLSNLYDNADSNNFSYEQAILNDWGRLSAVGQVINDPNNPWIWLDGAASVIADNAKPAYNYMFLRTLVPAKWQIAGYLAYDCYSGGFSDDGCVGITHGSTMPPTTS